MKPEQSDCKRFINEHQLAELIGLSVGSVRRWRSQKSGPKYVKIGASVRYNPAEVKRWIEGLPSGGGKPLNA